MSDSVTLSFSAVDAVPAPTIDHGSVVEMSPLGRRYVVVEARAVLAPAVRNSSVMIEDKTVIEMRW